MKIKLLVSILGIVIIGILAFRFSQKKPQDQETPTQEPTSVTVQSVQNAASHTQKIYYPAIVAGDQQVTVTAGSSGTITTLSFDLGTYVTAGKQLATIDAIGSQSSAGSSGLQADQIRALEYDIETSEQIYKRAKDAYKKDHSYANKKTKEIAEIELDAAKTKLAGAIDAQHVTAPITGTVIDRTVSVGDSVAIGKPIATISKTGLTKIQFYVSKDELPFITTGTQITIHADDTQLTGTVTTISPQADATTKRFLIEAKPNDKTTLSIGSVFTVSFDLTYKVHDQKNLIVPLSAITIGQNTNHIFVAQDNHAQKVSVNIIAVTGEMAEVTGDSITQDMQIIINGSKIVQDGNPITITQS